MGIEYKTVGLSIVPKCVLYLFSEHDVIHVLTPPLVTVATHSYVAKHMQKKKERKRHRTTKKRVR